MKTYIISIIGATLLSAVGGIASPEKWRGYVRIVTGLVIISCIVSPVLTVMHSGIWEGFDENMEAAARGEDIQSHIIEDELRKKISADIEDRMKSEFNLTVTADCNVDVNSSGGIEGVDKIYIYGARIPEGAKRRLCEVYGVDISEVYNE